MDSHSAFVHQGSNGQSRSQSQSSHRAIQFPSELEQGGGFHHVQHHNRHSHDDLSSLAMSAVDVVGFHSSELHDFSDMYKTRTSQPVVAAPYRGFGAPAESLRLQPGNSSSSFPEASIGHFDIPDTRAIPGGWDDESERLSTPLPSDAVGAPATMSGESRQGQDGQDGRKERQGSGHLPMTMRIVEKPPDLARWRQRLFDLEQMVVLSQDE